MTLSYKSVLSSHREAGHFSWGLYQLVRQRNSIFFMCLDLNWNPGFCKIINDVYFYCQPSSILILPSVSVEPYCLLTTSRQMTRTHAICLTPFYEANQCSSIRVSNSNHPAVRPHLDRVVRQKCNQIKLPYWNRKYQKPFCMIQSSPRMNQLK